MGSARRTSAEASSVGGAGCGRFLLVRGGLRLLRGNSLAALARSPALPDSRFRLRRLFAGYACAL